MKKRSAQSAVNEPLEQQRVVLAVPGARARAAECWKILAHAEILLIQFGIRSVRVELPPRFGAREAPVAIHHQAQRGARLWIVASPDEREAAALAAGAPDAPVVVRVPVVSGIVSRAKRAQPLAALVSLQTSGAATAAFATVALGEAGAKNAALLAVAILAAAGDDRLRSALQAFRRDQTEAVLAMRLPDDTGS